MAGYYYLLSFVHQEWAWSVKPFAGLLIKNDTKPLHKSNTVCVLRIWAWQYAKLGYAMKGLSSMGGTNFAIVYRKAEDMVLTGDDYESWGLLAVQDISDYGTSVYGGYSHMTYDTTLADFDDMDGIFMGMKVVF